RLRLVPPARRVDRLELEHDGLVPVPIAFEDLRFRVHSNDLGVTHRLARGLTVGLHPLRIPNLLGQDHIAFWHSSLPHLSPAPDSTRWPHAPSPLARPELPER